MKTILHTTSTFRQFLMLVIFSLSVILANAQPTGEMSFENPALEPGSVAGTANGAEYRFSDVNSQMDAIMTISGRSSSQVVINALDLTSSGFNKAFQPQIKFNNGSVSSASTWWIEFHIQFVNKDTKMPAQMTEFHVTGLDIDGNGSRLREWDAFYGGSSYTLENNSQLTVSNMVGTMNLPLMNGKQFMGSVTDRNNIDTSATEIMSTVKYTNTSSLIIRLGATTTGSASNANRMYSVWFKNFAYVAPISTLPVKLMAFTASSPSFAAVTWQPNFRRMILATCWFTALSSAINTCTLSNVTASTCFCLWALRNSRRPWRVSRPLCVSCFR